MYGEKIVTHQAEGCVVRMPFVGGFHCEGGDKFNLGVSGPDDEFQLVDFEMPSFLGQERTEPDDRPCKGRRNPL